MNTIGSFISIDSFPPHKKVITVASVKPDGAVVFNCNCGLHKPYYRCEHSNRVYNMLRHDGEISWDQKVYGWKLNRES